MTATVPSKHHRHDRWRSLRALAEDLPLFLTAPLYRRWHLRWEATEAEANARLPGDDLQPQAQFRARRAITIGAPPEVTAFKVADFEPHRWLSWTKPESSWVWKLTPTANGATRLVSRVHAARDWRRPASPQLVDVQATTCIKCRYD